MPKRKAPWNSCIVWSLSSVRTLWWFSRSRLSFNPLKKTTFCIGKLVLMLQAVYTSRIRFVVKCVGQVLCTDGTLPTVVWKQQRQNCSVISSIFSQHNPILLCGLAQPSDAFCVELKVVSSLLFARRFDFISVVCRYALHDTLVQDKTVCKVAFVIFFIFYKSFFTRVLRFRSKNRTMSGGNVQMFNICVWNSVEWIHILPRSFWAVMVAKRMRNNVGTYQNVFQHEFPLRLAIFRTV